jgi:hypothetical protein
MTAWTLSALMANASLPAMDGHRPPRWDKRHVITLIMPNRHMPEAHQGTVRSIYGV